MPLSERDKTPNPSGYGCTFQHTDPQRRVPCVLGNMLAPRSADDIPPITPEAMASVQAAIALLADLVGDRDHNLYLGQSQHQVDLAGKAREILLAGQGVAGILRMDPAAGDVDLHVRLTAGDVAALTQAVESSPHRDAAMVAIDKVLSAAKARR